MEKIQFYYNPMSRARIAHWMLEEAGASYDLHIMGFEKGDLKDPKYLAINPMGKIPAIVHRETVVTECAAICAYLADAFPEANLAPALNDPARGTFYRWLVFGAGCVETATLDKMLNRTEGLNPRMVGYGSYEDTMNALEKAVTPGPFILGAKFSAVDVYIASQIRWGLMIKAIQPRPAFTQYLENCEQRPAFQRAEKMANELIEKMKS